MPILTPLAIKIAAPRVALVLGTLHPAIAELDYDTQLHEQWIVFDYPKNGEFVIMTEEALDARFDKGEDTWFMKPILLERK